MGKEGRRNRRKLVAQEAQSSLLPVHQVAFALGNSKLPLVFIAALLLLCLTSRVQQNSVLLWSFVAATGGLVSWLGWLLFQLNRDRIPRAFNIVVRPQHYVQAMVQVSLFAYWGFFWRPVYDHALLILAQILFAYTFDILLTWSRQRDYVLGFGPFPIILSINLFLWFRDDWFYMQFLMIAVGFMGKEYLRWQREGRSVHIFNPSAFALGLFSLVLILTNTTSLTWGQEIASTLTLAPNIYTFLFLIGLVVMYFFSITLVAGMAAISLFGLSAIYSSAAGVPYFLDSEIPAAVFLGLHLLITDPSTSPRTPLGKTIFGMLYGLGVFGLYTLLGNVGVPTFYDKLLCVPLLNLSVIAIDRAVSSINFQQLPNIWRSDWMSGRANLAHMSIWIVVFAAMTLLGKTDGKHTGDSLPFWEQACTEDLPNACYRLVQLKTTYCDDNSAWACNELGIHYRVGGIVVPDTEQAF
nr:RnfABCDGE type electron transport complex subunit D [Gammaproteobacteria bacterium]